MTERISKRPPPVILEWVQFLRTSLRARRVFRPHVTEDALVRFAGYLGLCGPPTSPVAVKVYSALVILLFSWRRIRDITANLNFLPVTALELERVADAIIAAEEIESVEKANFPVGNFINVAVQLPDAKAYVAVCKRDKLEHIRKIFFPNTLKSAAQRYHGIVGQLADPAYRTFIRDAVKTIR